jgi:hypothetical protein
LRSELNSERARLTHSCRLLEETVVTKQNEMQALAGSLQVTIDTLASEKQALTQQNQQVRQFSSLHVI